MDRSPWPTRNWAIAEFTPNPGGKSVLKTCIGIVLAILVVSSGRRPASPPALIEVQVRARHCRASVSRTPTSSFWLQSQDGRLCVRLPADDVHKFRKISPQFSGWSGSIVRDKLRREFGEWFEVAGTRHYAVGAAQDRPGDQKAASTPRRLRNCSARFRCISRSGIHNQRTGISAGGRRLSRFRLIRPVRQCRKVDVSRTSRLLHAHVEPDRAL